jgi:putative transposase
MAKPDKSSTLRAEIHTINIRSPAHVILADACSAAKTLHNVANYFQKQAWLAQDRNNRAILSPFALRDVFIDAGTYKRLGGHIAAEVVIQVGRNWKSYRKAHNRWLSEYTEQINSHGIKYKLDATGHIRHDSKGDPIIDTSTANFLGEPRPPRYNKGSLNPITLDCGSFAQTNNIIIFPKRLGSIRIKPHTEHTIRSIRIIPKPGRFQIELVYKVAALQPQKDNGRYIGIDLGVNNFAAVVSTVPSFIPFVVDGRRIKSFNQYWNKTKAHYQSIAETLNHTKQTKRIQSLTEHRNNQINDFIHKASRYIADISHQHNISIIFIGKNINWKQRSNLGKHNNQNFVQLPHAKFISILTYKCAAYGIAVVPVDEHHTSDTSFIDHETPEKHESYLGKRICRGLFRAHNGTYINADVNAAYQIIQRANLTNVYSCAETIAAGEGRGRPLRPVRVSVYPLALTDKAA